MSLSIVFGTPTTAERSPRRAGRRRASVPSPPITTSASICSSRSVRMHATRRPRRGRTDPSATCRGSSRPRWRIPRTASRSSGGLALHQPVPAVLDPDDLVPVRSATRGDDRADHGVQPGAVAAAGQDPDPLHAGSLDHARGQGTAAPAATALQPDARRIARRFSDVRRDTAGSPRADAAGSDPTLRRLSRGTSACR